MDYCKCIVIDTSWSFTDEKLTVMLKLIRPDTPESGSVAVTRKMDNPIMASWKHIKLKFIAK